MSDRQTDYFVLLDMEHRFDINQAALEKNYFALQQQLHPDRFVNRLEQERTEALQQSMTVNDAYRTLKDPFKRGEYLLSLQGMRVKEGQGSVKPSQETLMAMMELRERLEETADLTSIVTEVEEERKSLLITLAALFTTKHYEAAAQEVIRLRYLDKALEEVKLKQRV